MSGIPVVEVDRLCKQYTAAAPPALNQLTFTVEQGSFQAVLGRSGSGKTTLFRCLNQLIRPDSGRIIVQGKDLTAANRREINRAQQSMATIFQQFNLIQRLTALENVLAGQLATTPLWRVALRRFNRTDEQWALYCLDRVGLLDLAERRADTLSGGQQQRVAVARALAQRPLLILADEPVASLDAESAATVLDQLKNIAEEEGIAVLCSLHQEEFALRYATRIVGLRQGELVVNVPRHAFGRAERSAIYK
jgi:phosphonate transport system ATP-binding protein